MRVDSRVITPMNARRSMLLAKPATVHLTSLASHADSRVTILLNALRKLLLVELLRQPEAVKLQLLVVVV